MPGTLTVMRFRIPSLLGAVAACSALLSPLLLTGSAQAAQKAPATGMATQHLILKAGGGTLALATSGVTGSTVYAGRYRVSNPSEQFLLDHEAGATFPGGRFGITWAPGGAPSGKYVHGTTSTAYLLNGAPAGTIFTAAPTSGQYTALTYLAGGSKVTKLELTYTGGGHVAFKPEGAGGPSANQLWKITG